VEVEIRDQEVSGFKWKFADISGLKDSLLLSSLLVLEHKVPGRKGVSSVAISVPDRYDGLLASGQLEAVET